MDRGLRPRHGAHPRPRGRVRPSPCTAPGVAASASTAARAWRTTASTSRASGPGLSVDGGMAEYLLVPAPRYLVPLGDMTPAEAAPLTDAGLTPYHAIKMGLPLLVPGLHRRRHRRRWPRPPRRAVPEGALPRHGHRGRPAGVGPRAGRRAWAPTTPCSPARGRRGGPRPSWAVAGPSWSSTSSATTTPSRSPRRSPRRSGRLTVVGVGGGTLPFNFFAFPYECSVQSTYWGSIIELQELLTLSRPGGFRVHAEQYSLDQAADVYRRWWTAPCRDAPSSCPDGGPERRALSVRTDGAIVLSRSCYYDRREPPCRNA